MKVRYLGSTSTACDLYRAAIPFKFVESDVDFTKDEAMLYMDKVTHEVRGMEIDADVVIVPRPSQKAQYQAARGAKLSGLAVVVEIDDELDATHKENHAHTFLEQGRYWLYRTMEIADLITCSTERLAEKYYPLKSVVVPNYVHDMVFDYEMNKDKHGIGWTGSIGVHPNDLHQVGDAIARVTDETGWKFRHIGDGDLSDIIKCNYVSYGEVDFSQYLLGIDTFALGIVPLEHSDFNDSKSWLKGIEYASAGVPFVASPRREYRKMKKEFKVGLLAKNPHEWYTKLKRLCKDDAERESLSKQYRETAYEHFRISTNAWKWDEAWAEAYERNKSGRL